MYKPAMLWLTRPQFDSELFAKQLMDIGIRSIVAPVLSVGSAFPPELAAASAPNALLLTSRHAVPALAQKQAEWAHLPVYCVGEATAEHANAAGFPHTITGEGDVQTLLVRVASELPAGASITYLSGDQTRVDVSALLTARGYGVEQYVTYHAVAETTLPRSLVQAINNKQLSGAVFFSPRSATIATKLLARVGLHENTSDLSAYCLSLAVSNAAAALPWKEIHASNAPTVEAMYALIVSHKHRKLL